MRTLLFVLTAFAAVGLAEASQMIAPLVAEPAQEASMAGGTAPVVVQDPPCAFDGSGCQQGDLPQTASPQELPAPATPPQAAEPAEPAEQGATGEPPETEDAHEGP